MSIFRDGILTGQGMIAIIFFAIAIFSYKIAHAQQIEMHKLYAAIALCIGSVFLLVFLFQVSGILVDIPGK